MTWRNRKVQSMLKTILNYHAQSNWVLYVMKTKQDTDVTDRIGAVYTKNNIELLWTIWSSADYDKN